jgi:hypothetical protein
MAKSRTDGRKAGRISKGRLYQLNSHYILLVLFDTVGVWTQAMRWIDNSIARLLKVIVDARVRSSKTSHGGSHQTCEVRLDVHWASRVSLLDDISTVNGDAIATLKRIVSIAVHPVVDFKFYSQVEGCWRSKRNRRKILQLNESIISTR